MLSRCRGELLASEAAEGHEHLRFQTPYATWCIVSGGDQAELREIFAARGLDHLFDGGIFGSPESKDHIIKREMASGNIRLKGLFLGDSRYDLEVASRARLDFIFVSAWTETVNWQELATANSLLSVEHVKDLLVTH
jgi:phosphoglycolate phosphatase-like HAD superfamily hydrolase